MSAVGSLVKPHLRQLLTARISSKVHRVVSKFDLSKNIIITSSPTVVASTKTFNMSFKFDSAVPSVVQLFWGANLTQLASTHSALHGTRPSTATSVGRSESSTPTYRKSKDYRESSPVKVAPKLDQQVVSDLPALYSSEPKLMPAGLNLEYQLELPMQVPMQVYEFFSSEAVDGFSLE